MTYPNAPIWAPGTKLCPWSELGPEVWEAIGWWAAWKVYGMLPGPGTLSEQAQYVTQAIEFAESEAREWAREEDRRRIQEAEAAREKALKQARR